MQPLRWSQLAQGHHRLLRGWAAAKFSWRARSRGSVYVQCEHCAFPVTPPTEEHSSENWSALVPVRSQCPSGTHRLTIWDKMQWLVWDRKPGGVTGAFQEAAASETQQIRCSGEGRSGRLGQLEAQATWSEGNRVMPDGLGGWGAAGGQILTKTLVLFAGYCRSYCVPSFSVKSNWCCRKPYTYLWNISIYLFFTLNCSC